MTKNSAISNPLAALVARASATLPTETGATANAAAIRARGDVRLVLADVSLSMAENATGLSKIHVLRDALKDMPATIPIIAFSDYARQVTAATIPTPNGGTALHSALQLATEHQPTHVLVISDGHPDDPQAALRAADQLGEVQIDVIYCGPDNDSMGIAFMKRLARGGGSARHFNIINEPRRLTQTVKLLASPRHGDRDD